jgi:Fe(3+) dicitrate transport protein
MKTTLIAGLALALPLSAAAADDSAPPPAPRSELQDEAERLSTRANAYPSPNEIVVSAARGVPLTYAGGRDVVEPETLARYPDANISTVLRRVPGVVVLPENGNDSRASFGLRGNDARRSGLTTILVDGVPISEAPYGNTDVDGLPIAFERVHRIDVIRGGASIRWGPNSAGGVINLVTEPIPDRPLARAKTRFGSHHDWSVASSIGGTWDQFGALLTAVDKGGDGFRDNSEYEDHDGSAKFRFAFGDDDELNLSISRFQELDAEQPGGLTQAAYDDDPTQSLRKDADFRFEANTYKADFTHRFGPASAFELIAWRYDGFRGLFDFRPILRPFTVHRNQNSDFAAGAVEARFTWTAELAGMKHAFFHSARYLTEKNREFYDRIPLPGSTASPSIDLDALFRGDSFATFNEDVVHVTDDVAIGLGARTESIDMGSLSRDPSKPRVTKDKSYHELLPEGSATWTFTKGAAVYASAQKNFYAPQYETGFDPTSLLLRPIQPEHSKSYELGTRVRAIEGLEFAGAWFATDFDDKIDFVNLPSGTKVAVNSGKARSRGFEASLSYDFGKAAQDLAGLSAFVTSTWMHSTIEAGKFDGNDLPNSPHRLASWGVEYDHASGAWARIGGSYTGKSFKDPDNFQTGSANGVTGPQPSYSLWDAAIGWRQSRDGTGFAVEAGVTNLFDAEHFRRFVSGIYPGAPRQVFFAASYGVAF